MGNPKTLDIRHQPGEGGATFTIARLSDGKAGPPQSLPSPWEFPVEGCHDPLMKELRWYLEEFLDYPFPPRTEHAERVLQALKAWGTEAFEALLGSRQAARLFEAATAQQYADLRLRIVSDDPRILSWPWEALHDPEVGFLAQTCRIERRLDKVRDPAPLAEGLPRDRVRILLVTARPFANDVGYRSISRPLVELIERRKLPAEVEVLRPPTFERLRERLREKPGRFHILHFDGHGSYGAKGPAAGGPYSLKAQGRLVFEDEKGRPDPIEAETLSELLQEHALPAVVLNACQSATLDDRSEDPFSSVAAALLRSGTRSVVAMAYSLYVSGAQQCLPAFYRRLFESGSVAEAVRAGRQQMRHKGGRVCARGLFDLQDWVVPVLYQQQSLDFSFAQEPSPQESPSRKSRLPEEIAQAAPVHGFVGRDRAILELERALRRPPAGVLIQGLGGIGKTTLAHGFLKWLDSTRGLEAALWISFVDVRSAEYVLNRMGVPFFGPDFMTLDEEAKIEALSQGLRERRCLIVWDNFESARGIEGREGGIPSQGQALLARLLERMRGGRSKVLITSRSREEWLGDRRRYVLPLGGLGGEERWAYCEAVLDDLGQTVDREDRDQVELMDLLNGHPLALQVVVPRLADQAARQLIERIQGNLGGFADEADPAQAQLFATLRLAQESLPEALQELLFPLSLHEGFVDLEYLEAMASKQEGRMGREEIDRFAETLSRSGLLTDRGQSIHEIHPLLTSYLRSLQQRLPPEQRDAWRRSFVDFMGSYADQLAGRQLHEQRAHFHLHGSNFRFARAEAKRLGMDVDLAALTQALGAYALNSREFISAAELYKDLAAHYAEKDQAKHEAAAYHQLGMIAQERRELGQAQEWYLKSLAIGEKQGNDHGAAITYHNLGTIAQERREFGQAQEWYLKSLAIKEKQGNDHGAAITYHQLGMIAQKRRELGQAQEWYLKSLAIKEKQGDDHGAAITYHQLGRIAQERRELGQAQEWCLKSLAIWEKQGNDHGAAKSYHQLGIIAQERRELGQAQEWYLKSLAIWEKQGDDHGAAITYHQLGTIAQERREFEQAQEWYLKSLAIKEKQGDDHGAASTCWQLGLLEGEQERFEESGSWLIRSVLAFLKANDPEGARRNTENFIVSMKRAPLEQQEALKRMWREAGLPSVWESEDDDG